MTLHQIARELASVEAELRPLLSRKESLEREERRLRSQAFIDANGVTRWNIEMSSGDDKPRFQMITGFADWMRKANCQKRFCEWNGFIYFTAEVLAGRLDRDAPGRVEDLSQ